MSQHHICYSTLPIQVGIITANKDHQSSLILYSIASLKNEEKEERKITGSYMNDLQLLKLRDRCERQSRDIV